MDPTVCEVPAVVPLKIFVPPGVVPTDSRYAVTPLTAFHEKSAKLPESVVPGNGLLI